MLALPVEAAERRAQSAELLRAARPLASPLVLSGLSPSLGALVQRIARARTAARSSRRRRARSATFPPQQLVPGASFAVVLSTGAIAAGAIGTVTYRDGDVVYGFGHPLDAAGRRALLLYDAYVFTVVGNPLDIGEAASYKLAAPGPHARPADERRARRRSSARSASARGRSR